MHVYIFNVKILKNYFNLHVFLINFMSICFMILSLIFFHCPIYLFSLSYPPSTVVYFYLKDYNAASPKYLYKNKKRPRNFLKKKIPRSFTHLLYILLYNAPTAYYVELLLKFKIQLFKSSLKSLIFLDFQAFLRLTTLFKHSC